MASAQDVFDEIERGIKEDPSVIKTVGGVFHFVVDGKSWAIDLKNAPGSVSTGAPKTKADVTMTLNTADFIKLMTGQANGQQLFMQGKLKMQGNMALAMKLEKITKKKVDSSPVAKAAAAAFPAGAPAAAATAKKGPAATVFDELSSKIAANPSLVQQIGGIYQFDISIGGKPQSWVVDLKNGKGSVAEGKHDKPECTLTVGEDDFVGMMTGKLNSQQLFMQGKLKIKGNMGLAMKLGKLNSTKSNL